MRGMEERREGVKEWRSGGVEEWKGEKGCLESRGGGRGILREKKKKGSCTQACESGGARAWNARHKLVHACVTQLVEFQSSLAHNFLDVKKQTNKQTKRPGVATNGQTSELEQQRDDARRL